MKMASRPQMYRLKRIVEMIRGGMEGGRLPNTTDFRRELELSRPTVMRYLAWLRDDEGAPIEFVPGRNGYRLTEKTWTFKGPEMTKGELTALLMARKLATVFRGTPWEQHTRRAFAKVASSFGGRVDHDMAALVERFSVIEEDYVPQNPDVWLAVGRQTVRGERMKIEYQRFDGRLKNYEVDPLHLYAYHGNWYVLARKTADGAIATFAVSRVRKVAGCGTKVVMPNGFDPDAHMMESFGIVRGETAFGVRLLFSSAVAPYIRERVWHKGQRIKDRPDGSVELAFRTAGWKELVRWVLSWQPDCRVLEPRRLRDRIVKKMKEGVERQIGLAAV